MASSEHSSSPGFDTTTTIDSSEPSTEFEESGFLAKFHSRRSSASSNTHAHRRSFSLLSSLPDQFATLIRSHSSSVRKSPRNQSASITSKAFFSGYADQPTLVQEYPVRSSLDMLSTRPSQEEDRPSSRKLKSENRLYNFLTRSRSRSRSKNEQSSPDFESTTRPMPDLQENVRSQAHNSVGRRSALPSSPGSKPPTRVQSRPLSSTTTATNTTITPGTPKAKKRPHTATAAPVPASSFSVVEGTQSQSRPSTPKPSGARKKLHDLFGIPLGRLSSSRSRSRSRPSSPRASLDVPPLPTSPGMDDDPTPRPRNSFSPHGNRISRPRSPSPTPTPKILRVTNATTTSSSTGSTAASIKISKFFTKGNGSASEQKKLSAQAQHSSSGPSVLPPVPPIVSAPLKRVTSLHRRSMKDPIPDLPQRSSNPGPPKIIHTPPTPLKNGNGSSAEGSKPPLTSARQGYHAAKGSLDSGLRYRGRAMSVLDEEGRSDFTQKTPQSPKGKTREAEGPGHVVPRPGPIKMSNSARSTKHGSFDFERPGWGAAAIQRTGSNGTANTGNTAGTSGSGWSGMLNREAKERESAYGPGLAGVGTLQRETSMKRAQEREQQLRMKEREKARKPTALLAVGADKEKEKQYKEKEREKEKPRLSSSQRTTPSGSTTERVHGSTSTGGTGAGNVKNSSLSKATGKRYDHGHKTASGSGVARLLGGLTAHHGPFSFEPPVPSPTRSTGSNGTTATAHDASLLIGSESWKDKNERERERVQMEKERQRDLRRGGGRSGDRAPVPVPIPASAPSNQASFGLLGTTPPSAYPTTTNAGHRSGTKGRSLDLGLGLSWAPSKVREEALLPSSTFFARSFSGSSAMGRSASGSTTGRSNGGGGGSSSGSRSGSGSGQLRGNGGVDPDAERSRLGREVAEVFKNVLDVEEYKLFKTYVHQFDAHEIPFDGPMGIVSLVERLLVSAPHLGEDGKRRLLDNFVRIILQHA